MRWNFECKVYKKIHFLNALKNCPRRLWIPFIYFGMLKICLEYYAPKRFKTCWSICVSKGWREWLCLCKLLLFVLFAMKVNLYMCLWIMFSRSVTTQLVGIYTNTHLRVECIVIWTTFICFVYAERRMGCRERERERASYAKPNKRCMLRNITLKRC